MASQKRLKKLRSALSLWSELHERRTLTLAALTDYRIPRNYRSADWDRATVVAFLDDLRTTAAQNVRVSFGNLTKLRDLIDRAELSASDARLDRIESDWNRRITRYVDDPTAKL